MPGLVGFTTPLISTCKSEPVISAMQDSLVHRSSHKRDELFQDSCVCASRVHLDTVRDGPQPASEAGIFVWLDGEIYNHEEFGASGLSGAHLIAREHRDGGLAAFLKKADGIFSAIIYDRPQKNLAIVNDRYGLRHLYVLRCPDGLAWASELKAFRCLPSRSLTVDHEAASLFIAKGYLTGNRTWFRHIELLAPGTMLSVACATGEVISQRYVDWAAAKDGKATCDPEELARELGDRFIRAVDRRCGQGESVAVSLSGGLDSRAIFAAMPARCEPVQAYSFGTPDCADLRIAQRVAALRPSQHHSFEITEANWLNGRIDAVWLTDGQFNMLHMHGVEHAETIGRQFGVQLNGFQSDMLLGACFEDGEGREISLYGDQDRRFNAMGIVIANDCIVSRVPFFDNALMELMLSVPLKLRRKSNMYHRMLLTAFPRYFRDIPWKATGMPISRKGPSDKALVLAKKCLRRLMPKLSVRAGSIIDYPSWIRKPPGREFFTELLSNKNALIFDFVEPALISRCLDRHLQGMNFAERIGRYATLEIWLRRFYEMPVL
jgi:asparagine synthase (glutamine-hydrolysing)